MFPQITSCFITTDERDVLVDWANDQYDFGEFRHKFNKVVTYDELTNIPKTFWDVRKRIARALDIDNIEAGLLTSFLSVTMSVHELGPHRDPLLPWQSGRHLRCNVFVQLPEEGGQPVILEKVYGVPERGLLCFWADQDEHYFVPVRGDKRRIICSYGFLVPDDSHLLK